MEDSNNFYKSKKDIERIELDFRLPEWFYILRDIYLSKDDCKKKDKTQLKHN